MAFSTSSFFAGVGTVFAAVTIGFAGGAMITSSPKMEPNRLERVAANTPITAAAGMKAETKAETPAVAPAPAVKAEAPAAAPVLAAKNETPETTAPFDRVISTTQAPVSRQAPVSQQIVPPQPQPAVAKEDFASQIDNAKKIREGELRKQADAERRADQRRRKRHEIEAAVNAVRRMQRDGVLQDVVSQQDDAPRLGFFGHD
jgi:hypothetical protein